MRSLGVVGATSKIKSISLDSAILESFSASSYGRSGTTSPETPTLVACTQNSSRPLLISGFE